LESKNAQVVLYVSGVDFHKFKFTQFIDPLNAELNPICHLLALLRAHNILHV